MPFETESDVLHWYDRQERVLTPAFLHTIPWHQVKDTVLHPKFVPVLLYMRDIERATEIYHDELRRSPTGQDPVIRRFLDRWREEEVLHGDLHNRFLGEAGYPTENGWWEKFTTRLPRSYWRRKRQQAFFTRPFGHHFAAVHMAWGATQELLTLSGYRRLWESASHPVLEYLLRAIAREEARHALFYWSVARLKLARSRFSQRLARFLMDHFWKPVGEDIKSKAEANMLVTTLFGGHEGLIELDSQVNRRIAELPGFQGFTRVRDRIREGQKAISPSLHAKPC